MMTPSSRGVVTALGATAIAVSGFFSPDLVLATVVVGIVVFALGWPALIDLPTVRGPAVVISLTGLSAVVGVRLSDVSTVTVVMGLAVIAAFVHQMLRRDGRPRLVESVSGVVTGSVVVVAAVLWVAVDEGPGAEARLVAGAAALAVAAACTVLPLPPSAVATIATIGAAGTGLLVGYLLPPVGLLAGAIVGAGSGILTAAVHILFGRFPYSARPLPAFAAAMVPLLVGAVPVYLADRLLTL